MKAHYSPQFYKQYKKANVRIQKAFDQRIKIFLKNPLDPYLNNHELCDEYEGYRSIDITPDWRAIYEEVTVGDEVFADFIAIGTHDQLYR